MQIFAKIVVRLKQIFNPIDVYSSQRFLLRSSCFFGMIPYRLVKKNDTMTLQVSVFGFISAIVYVIVFGICFMSTILNQLNLMEFFVKSPISNFGGNLNLITSFLSITSVYLSSLSLRKKFKEMLSILSRIDFKFFDLGVLAKHRETLKYNFKSSALATLALGFFVGTGTRFLVEKNIGNLNRTSVIITHFWPYVVMMNLILTFLNISRLIRLRFEAANKVSH